MRPLPTRAVPAVPGRSGPPVRRRRRAAVQTNASDEPLRTSSATMAALRWPCGSSHRVTDASSACSTARTSCSTWPNPSTSPISPRCHEQRWPALTTCPLSRDPSPLRSTPNESWRSGPTPECSSPSVRAPPPGGSKDCATSPPRVRTRPPSTPIPNTWPLSTPRPRSQLMSRSTTSSTAAPSIVGSSSR